MLRFKRYIAEFLGTFCMVFAGTAAIVVNDLSGGMVTHVGVALVFGLIVAAAIYSFGDISGAHINPAVTLGFWIARRLPGAEVLPYWAAQFLGAITASLCVWLVLGNHADLGATIPTGTALQSFLMEVLLTFILMLTIISVATGAKEKGIMTGVAVGGVVALAALFAGPISGASMNPARSLGPALIGANMAEIWLYLSAPPLGAAVAILACRGIREPGCCAGKCIA